MKGSQKEWAKCRFAQRTYTQKLNAKNVRNKIRTKNVHKIS